MIGVCVDSSEHAAVCEFFELFKTPWEFYRRDRCYDVLLCAGAGEIPDTNARLIILFAGCQIPFDLERRISIASELNPPALFFNQTALPLYGRSVAFRSGLGSSPVLWYRSPEPAVLRIGYDLFAEIQFLLTRGQPVVNANIAALDLHIGLLRDAILESGIPLVEVPPVPGPYRFAACLTHDLDHPRLRLHKLDRTMFGFLYRATLGSVNRLARGRLSTRDLLRNWLAALKLPLVYLGLADDFWREFPRYAALESAAASTFFVIPFKQRPGRNAPAARAAGYGAADISNELRLLASAGCEIGLHGIDAWCDSSQALAESNEIRRVTAHEAIGARMHWLYYDQQAPLKLEQTGIDYDSSIGYNETVGFRAGTTQTYKPLSAKRLLELPLLIMDTALFYPCHLDLSSEDAWLRVVAIIEHAISEGGCVTVNWHDRSIGPERHWGRFYSALVAELRTRGAWFATAAQSVTWFRQRRSVEFENVTWEPDRLRATIAFAESHDLPGLRLRLHRAKNCFFDFPIRADTGSRADAYRCRYTLDTALTAPMEQSAAEDCAFSHLA